MKIGILGAGQVAQTLAAGLAKSYNEVMIGARNPAKVKEWAAQNPQVKTGSLSQAAAHGELLFNATRGAEALLLIWVTMMMKAGKPAFQFIIVR
jgi:predicted dinucleotide-binding enzyme